jgi:murein DD-endopeptidase MepM/ murein hydrolase activator NlpD
MNGASSPIDVLKVPAGPDPATASGQPRTPEQLRLLAAQFESMLLSQMLSQMRSWMFDDEGGDTGFAKGPLGDAMYSELSLALSRAGGFGLADSMMAPLMREAGETMPDMTATLGMPASTITMPDPAGPAGPAGRSALFDGTLTSSFGWRQHPVSGGMKFHQGVDIAMPTGRDVPAARGGHVTFAGEQGGYGLTVIVNHGEGVSTRYAHLSEIKVKAGDSVADGQSIALSGATGRVTGAHLHFEVLEHGRPIDPATAVGRLHARK